MFTVKFRAAFATAGTLMADMRVWLDKRRAVPLAFHCHPAPSGVEIEISFKSADDASACEREFEQLAIAI
jgi:hypothetical protein